MNVSPFEIGMLICFGASWPISIIKLYTAKKSDGKSLLFAAILMLGYFSGILHKLFYNFDYVIYLYVFNVILVSIDMWLTIKYSSNNDIKCLPAK